MQQALQIGSPPPPPPPHRRIASARASIQSVTPPPPPPPIWHHGNALGFSLHTTVPGGHRPFQPVAVDRPAPGSPSATPRVPPPAIRDATTRTPPAQVDVTPHFGCRAVASAREATAGSDGRDRGKGHSAAVSSTELVDKVVAKHGYCIARNEHRGPSLPAGALGRGGFGMVYKAHKNGQAWAMKMAEGVACAQDVMDVEIRVMSLLEHPSIVQCVEAFSYLPKQWTFIVMEFVDGGNLQRALTHQPATFCESLVRPMMFHLASALAYAHDLCVMHRDIKPENILLQKDLFPKIADFGLARAVMPSQMAYTIVGTPAYMAPEIHDPRVPYDLSADVFSLGLVLASMIDPKSCCAWALDAHPKKEREALKKRWPMGTTLPKFSPGLQALQKSMVHQAPGRRPTAYQVDEGILQLHEDDPLDHPMWDVPTRCPEGPPPVKAVKPEDAAEIAGRGGYAVGVPVQVLVEGSWHKGKVKRVSTTLCPGAVQVHYTEEGTNGSETAVLICPWQFPELLRPAPPLLQSSGPSQAPFGTMIIGDGNDDDDNADSEAGDSFSCGLTTRRHKDLAQAPPITVPLPPQQPQNLHINAPRAVTPPVPMSTPAEQQQSFRNHPPRAVTPPVPMSPPAEQQQQQCLRTNTPLAVTPPVPMSPPAEQQQQSLRTHTPRAVRCREQLCTSPRSSKPQSPPLSAAPQTTTPRFSDPSQQQLPQQLLLQQMLPQQQQQQLPRQQLQREPQQQQKLMFTSATPPALGASTAAVAAPVGRIPVVANAVPVNSEAVLCPRESARCTLLQLRDVPGRKRRAQRRAGNAAANFQMSKAHGKTEPCFVQ